MTNISAIIVVKDYPVHIFETINSIRNFVSEIVIFDIGINPALKTKISQDSINRLIEYKNPPSYIELIREETKKLARNDWILFIDPDEIFPNQLIQIVKKNINHSDYFSIPRKNIIFGKWIKHSRWWPDYQVRIFKKNQVIWPKIIHHQPKAQGKEYRVEAKEELALLHHNYRNLDEFFSKMIRYAKAEAQEKIDKKKEITLSATISKSISEFISRYFAEDGYKDGLHGFVLAFLQMFYYFIVYFYFWEKNKYPSQNLNDINTEARSFFNQGLLESNFWLIKKNLVKYSSSLKLKIQNFLSSVIN